jgi:hypothetical protein
MSRFKAGSMSGEQLMKEFGLQGGSDVGDGFNAGAGATDSDQTKGNAALGNGYLTDETYEKLKGDARVKEAYAAINGQEAADKKFKDGSISINTMDALFDDLTQAPKSEEQAEAPVDEPVVLSDRAAKAKAYSKAYEDVMLPRQGDYVIKNDQSVVDDFDAQYTLNLFKEKQPQTPKVLQQAEAEADPVETEAKQYAKDYKLAVGDMLRPANRDF